MPKLIWKLKDPKSCEGCPLLFVKSLLCFWQTKLWDIGKDNKRPQACIDELGE